MDIWEKLYLEAKALYAPQEISDFVYARHVVAAVEAAFGQIFYGLYGRNLWRLSFMCRTSSSSTCINNQDRPRSSALCFRDKPLWRRLRDALYGACREFLLELDAENRHLEFMVDCEPQDHYFRRTDAFGGAKSGLVKEKIKE